MVVNFHCKNICYIPGYANFYFHFEYFFLFFVFLQGLCERVVGKNYNNFDDWWNSVHHLQVPKRNFTNLLQGFKADTWEYKLYEKIFEKQQATVATMVTFAQNQKPANCKPNQKITKNSNSELSLSIYIQVSSDTQM